MFCSICNNLLSVDIVDDNLMFVCNNCINSYKANADDSLRYEEIKGSDIAIFEKILKKIPDDPVNIKLEHKCEKCGHGIAKAVRLGDEMKLIYSCLKCREISY